ncbi:hypothetical protein M433DRAFT_68665 [Acidomyces richmondensis BFW]|nr:MAG: hypothetical protein FE78DRAFT_81131 [Acidomyces sp. 'richmondensis']KYG44775.1 hypothetical protein M433DRAFT_68665 [Acidomyces richmondensis BFW]
MKFSDAITVRAIDSHTYRADFIEEYTIGTVPHGGFVTSCFLSVVRKHFDTTLRKQLQPHTIALHLDFLRRTQTGQAIFRVEDVKLGRQTSVVHVTLTQDGREEVVGYITNSNIDTEKGVSFDTHWEIHPQPLPVDISKLDSDTDELWGERKEWPFSDFRKATRQIRAWFPRRGQYSPAIVDQWICLRDPGDRWTNESIGFVVDTFPQIVEVFALDGLDAYGIDFEEKHSQDEQKLLMKGKAKMWYPTLLLNLELKKSLPAEGLRYLYVRLQCKMIKNGRYDLELLVKDPLGDLVALSHHVVLAVSSDRNLASRRKPANPDSKL